MDGPQEEGMLFSSGAVPDRAGFAILFVIPFKAEGDRFSAAAGPAVRGPQGQWLVADRTGQHGKASVPIVQHQRTLFL